MVKDYLFLLSLCLNASMCLCRAAHEAGAATAIVNIGTTRADAFVPLKINARVGEVCISKSLLLSRLCGGLTCVITSPDATDFTKIAFSWIPWCPCCLVKSTLLRRHSVAVYSNQKYDLCCFQFEFENTKNVHLFSIKLILCQ